MNVSSHTEPCRNCGELPAYAHADLARGESLPAAVGRLEEVADEVEIADELMKCPVCESYFRYRYVYEYIVYGSDEDAYLERITREEAIRLLMHSRKLTDNVFRELARLGVEDAYAKIIQRLRQAVDNSDEPQSEAGKSARHYALLTLVEHFLATNPAQLDGLLEHPDSWIRSRVLYFLQTRGADEVPRFVKRLSDPDAYIRSQAHWALRKHAERGGDISEAMAALTSLLTGDPAPDVRRQAADILAAAAAKGANIAAAVPALTAALSGDFGLAGAAAAALRNAAAQGTDISAAVPPLRRCCEEADRFPKAVQEVAGEALRHVEARQKERKA